MVKNHFAEYILIGGLEHVLFFHILGIMIPTDFNIFQRVRSTTNQYHGSSVEVTNYPLVILTWLMKMAIDS